MLVHRITLPGLETEVMHAIIYIETIRWAVKSFEVIRGTYVLPNFLYVVYCFVQAPVGVYVKI